jgi:U3 small nucleolar RNA-associated protein MPP10
LKNIYNTIELHDYVCTKIQLIFSYLVLLAPVITTETTDSIEDLIKQRIRDKVFDDVERKKKTQNGDEAQTYKKEILLEHEKSKMSLAQVYEQEYMKKQTVNKFVFFNRILTLSFIS